MSEAADAPGVSEGTRDVGALRLTMQRTGHLRELQGDPGFEAAPPPFVSNLEMRQGLAKAGPLLCVSDLGVYYSLPAESRTLRIKDVSQATQCGFREVERPQLCTVKKTQSSRRFSKAPRPQSPAMAALAAAAAPLTPGQGLAIGD